MADWPIVLDQHSGVTGDGPFTYSQIQTAAAVVCVWEARKQTALLGQLLNRLDSLGSDGIHTLIKHEAARVRKVERLRRQRQAQKRRAQRATKLAAAGAAGRQR